MFKNQDNYIYVPILKGMITLSLMLFDERHMWLFKTFLEYYWKSRYWIINMMAWKWSHWYIINRDIYQLFSLMTYFWQFCWQIVIYDSLQPMSMDSTKFFHVSSERHIRFWFSIYGFVFCQSFGSVLYSQFLCQGRSLKYIRCLIRYTFTMANTNYFKGFD